MFGIEMMLKNMGLDPDALKESVENFGRVVVDIKQQLDRIENKLDALNASNNQAGENSPAEIATLKIAGE